MTHPPSASAVSAGLLAAFVGFASSFAVILQGLTAVGASKAEAASGLMALSVAMGVCGIVLSLRTKMPISVAWSTPGAALLATSALPAGGFPAAVGAFVVAAALVVAAGLLRPLGRAIAAIPASLASAMLAGVVFGLCLAPVKAIAADPLSGLLVAGSWLVMTRIRRLLAVPVAALVAGVLIVLGKGLPPADAALLPHPILVVPSFDATDMIGIALPLFLVTMASQNIPGLAILRVNGYAPEPGPLFRMTGLFSILSAPFGGHAVNLAAITAAICAGDEAGPNRAARYWAAVVSGFGYIVFGLAAGLVTAFAALEPVLIQAVAGLALIGAFASALQGAMAVVEEREAAAATFLVTASGIAFLGISPAFWGLVAGAATLAVTHLGKAKA
ncbi:MULTISPECIES: benzoate/H(+) symporter BenE family transporter [unclassified Aureimonas]|uniref:benzoate/H(+) symporter BenE family transporter n=1 Tax=unclassified Aureimonas TaxID=2615206 RepID=UPI0006F4D529|nr:MULTISPECIES: benzoate/H(+) symporter BenE family transporter [unclassified Aureimonas]KQT66109.1 benzoate transporter [Aureimonas sp. Leaf427]KQT81027.1 benzoate transporter [Aureimonas sp. Leaf460]